MGERYYTLQIFADTGEVIAVTDTHGPLVLPVAKAGERQVEFVTINEDEFNKHHGSNLNWKKWNRTQKKMEAM